MVERADGESIGRSADVSVSHSHPAASSMRNVPARLDITGGRILRPWVSILAVAYSALGAARAQAPTARAPAEANAPAPGERAGPALTRADAEAWLDGVMPMLIESHDIAGALVAVVKNGDVLLQKGYGYSDVQHKTPVDPERTLFRLGSISKVFAATAALQLVEQGKLDLGRDIDQYLDFKIPYRFGKPITLRHLLTHTAGFEEGAKDAWMLDREPPPLRAYLPAHLPAQIFPPGEVTAYSNYGMALVGRLVERASGEEFAEYAERHIFQPLGMVRSTFRQPLPIGLRGDVSNGYVKASEAPRPFEICVQTSAGSLSSTGADMARFMIAHLQQGRYGDQQILQPETARLMQTRVPDAFPAVNGMALAFHQSDRNGRRIISHGGDTGLFHSEMYLYLDDGVGFFISFNSTGTGGDVRGEVLNGFTDRYFPAPDAPEAATIATAREHARMAAGRYQSSRRWESSFFRILGLIQTSVTAEEDGTIIVPVETGPGSTKDVSWREIAPFVWREIGGPGRIAMTVRGGRVQAIKNNDLSSMELLRVPAWRSAAWNVPLLVGTLIVLFGAILVWPVAAMIRHHYRLAFPLSGLEARVSRLARIGAMAIGIFLVSWVTVLRNLVNGNLHFLSQAEPRVRMIQVIGVVGIVGAGLAIWNAVLAWRCNRDVTSKVGTSLLAFACSAAVWFIAAFKLITARLVY
jgi:CubicO group peptidase (beta-lactamase class C family)